MGPIFFHLRRKLDAARAEARKAGGEAAAAVEQTHRVYGYRLVLTGALWASVYGISRGLLEMEIAKRWIRVAIALIPIPFFISFLWLWMKGLNPDDWSYRHVWLMMPMLYYFSLWRATRCYE